MNHIRLDVIQQTLIVRDYDSGILRSPQLVHAMRYDTQGIDIQTTIRLIQDRQFRLQHRHLEDLVPLFLSTGETFVHATAGQFIIQLDDRTFLTHQFQEVRSRNRFQTVIFTVLVQRRTHKVHHTDPRDLDRILEAQENTLTATILRRKIQQILTVEDNLSFRYLKSGITYQYTT